MNIFVFGSSIVSSYWNGAATYYRGCYKYLSRLGYEITFAEPDAYSRQQHRDEGGFSYVTSIVYRPGADLDRMLALASEADIVIKHSGIGVDDTVLEHRVLECAPRSMVFFWDVDAPATLARMTEDPSDSFRSEVAGYDAVFTYGGGPLARDGYASFGARAYYSIYNGLDPETHYPVTPDPAYACDLAFLGNRLPDREARVEELFLRAAELAPEKAFLLGGEGWGDKRLPSNVRWIGHVPTAMHNLINCSAGAVININRSSMAEFGFSPPTRVFEVAGTGSYLLCDDWNGLSDCFEPTREIVAVKNAVDVIAALRDYSCKQKTTIGHALRRRTLQQHTYADRAVQAHFAFRDCLARRKGHVPAQSESLATIRDWTERHPEIMRHERLASGLHEEATV